MPLHMESEVGCNIQAWACTRCVTYLSYLLGIYSTVCISSLVLSAECLQIPFIHSQGRGFVAVITQIIVKKKGLISDGKRPWPRRIHTRFSSPTFAVFLFLPATFVSLSATFVSPSAVFVSLPVAFFALSVSKQTKNWRFKTFSQDLCPCMEWLSERNKELGKVIHVR